MWIARSSKAIQYVPRKSRHVLLLVITLLVFILIFRWKSNFENVHFCSYIRYYNRTDSNIENGRSSSRIQYYNNTNSSFKNSSFLSYMRYNNEIKDGYLVWSSKCHMPSEDPMHPSILKFVEKIDYEECSTLPLLTSIVRETNETFSLVINSTIAQSYENFICCWTPITRPKNTEPLSNNWDSIIDEGNCTDFETKVVLPSTLEIVMVSCRASENATKEKAQMLYKNIHAIINPAKVLNHRNISQFINNNFSNNQRKMSILIIGIDSVSRLNFLRSLPKTEKYLRESGWFNLKGYNKVGLNTFPNLMAILTGHNESSVESTCTPNKPYGLDKCPFLWHGYEKAGYVTAYGEDYGPWSTFNFGKAGFVNAPTNYYLRAYIIATEKLLKPRYKFVNMYCTGPELAVNRIFDYASTFAKSFLDVPYFGFFWANSVSHNDLNAISSMDTYFLNYFQDLERQGVFNNTIVIFLSDHGLRFGKFRETYLGWYEERLPFIYFHIPHHQGYSENYQLFQALKINEYRLASPYDLYETLRDVLMRSGVTISSSSGCPTCQTLFRPVPRERSCADAGISPHWCTCGTNQLINEIANGTIAREGVTTFLNYIYDIIKEYKDKNGQQLCAQLQLKKIHYINQLMETSEDIKAANKKYSFRIEVSPGSGIFEFLIYANENSNFTIHPEEISRINSYANDSKCLNNEFKKFCTCLHAT